MDPMRTGVGAYFQNLFNLSEETKQPEKPGEAKKPEPQRFQPEKRERFIAIVTQAHSILTNQESPELNEVITTVKNLNEAKLDLQAEIENITKVKIKILGSAPKTDQASPTTETSKPDQNLIKEELEEIKNNKNALKQNLRTLESLELNQKAKQAVNDALKNGTLFDQIKSESPLETMKKVVQCRELAEDITVFDEALLSFCNKQPNKSEYMKLLNEIPELRYIDDLREIAHQIKKIFSTTSDSQSDKFVEYMTRVDAVYPFSRNIGGIKQGRVADYDNAVSNFYRDIYNEITDEGDQGKSFICELDKAFTIKIHNEKNKGSYERIKLKEYGANQEKLPDFIDDPNLIDKRNKPNVDVITYDYGGKPIKETQVLIQNYTNYVRTKKKSAKESTTKFIGNCIHSYMKDFEKKKMGDKNLILDYKDMIDKINNEIIVNLQSIGYKNSKNVIDPQHFNRYNQELISQVAKLYISNDLLNKEIKALYNPKMIDKIHSAAKEDMNDFIVKNKLESYKEIFEQPLQTHLVVKVHVLHMLKEAENNKLPPILGKF